MPYTMTIDQIGSKGTIYCETNFGFAFTANYVESWSQGRARPALIRRRVINILSFCCQAALDSVSIDGQISRKCKVCGKLASELPKEDFSREYPDFETDNLTHLERIVSRANIDSLEAIIVASEIAHVLKGFWDHVGQGERTRQILTQKEFNSEIVLFQ